MTRSKIIDRHGNEVHGDVVPDGGRIVVALPMMDANSLPFATMETRPMQHSSRYASMTDTQRNARAEMHRLRDQRIQNAWRNPSMAPVAQAAQETPVARPAAPSLNAADAGKQREAYAARCARLENAWKDAR
jgi:hypothetical protein